jgi:hypothetical protein
MGLIKQDGIKKSPSGLDAQRLNLACCLSYLHIISSLDFVTLSPTVACC